MRKGIHFLVLNVGIQEWDCGVNQKPESTDAVISTPRESLFEVIYIASVLREAWDMYTSDLIMDVRHYGSQYESLYISIKKQVAMKHERVQWVLCQID
jgi:hypothetical protein